MVEIIPRYLEHKSGSKFYEVLTFSTPAADLVVKRYGSMAQFKKPGVGPTPIVDDVRGTAFTAAADDACKPKLTAGKGYKRLGVEYGFHTAMSDSLRSVDNDEFLITLRKHYSEEVSRTIAGKLNIGFASIPSAKAADLKIASTRDRGEAWGSW